MDWFTKSDTLLGTGTNTNTGTETGGTGNNWWDSSSWGNFAAGASALSGLASAWTGMQQLSLAQDQFAFQKDAYSTDLANQATVTNSAIEDSYRRRAAVAGADVTESEYGTLANYQANRNVSGTL